MTDDLRIHIDEAMTLAAAHLGKGRVADYIPALAEVDPNKLGFALALPDGTVHTAGDSEEPFSIQSVSRVGLTPQPSTIRARRRAEFHLDVANNEPESVEVELTGDQ